MLLAVLKLLGVQPALIAVCKVQLLPHHVVRQLLHRAYCSGSRLVRNLPQECEQQCMTVAWSVSGSQRSLPERAAGSCSPWALDAGAATQVCFGGLHGHSAQN